MSYLVGLLSPLASKNGWTLAEAAGDGTPDRMQRLLNRSAGDADAVRDYLFAYVAERLARDDRVVRFRTGSTTVEVAIEENTPTTRDFPSMLPMTLPFEECGGRKKVTTLSRRVDYDGATGMTLENADPFSYMPWGNLGFFYRADGLGHSDDLVRTGTTDDLHLDGQNVRIGAAG
ncbi:hypothetical protein C5N14_29340 [Micromonospora sp. MW-13]|nr:hypothetical protein C5N14_29340 [Micromonospora sp. MW-13]